MTPKQLVGSNVYLIGNEKSTLTGTVVIKRSILQASFTNLILVPQGSYVRKNTELQGRIEFHFGAVGEWEDDLGSGVENGG